MKKNDSRNDYCFNEILKLNSNDAMFEIYLNDFINDGVLNDKKIALISILFKKVYTDVLSDFYLRVLRCDSDDELSNVISEYANINNECDNIMFCQSGLKMFWYAESLVLVQRGYPRIIDCLPKIFEWFQDMNWPGSMEIFNMVSSFPKKVLADNLEKSTKDAIEQNDYGWLYWLREVLEFNNIGVDLFKDKNLFMILKNATEM